jgi:hypothetical protein
MVRIAACDLHAADVLKIHTLHDFFLQQVNESLDVLSDLLIGLARLQLAEVEVWESRIEILQEEGVREEELQVVNRLLHPKHFKMSFPSSSIRYVTIKDTKQKGGLTFLIGHHLFLFLDFLTVLHLHLLPPHLLLHGHLLMHLFLLHLLVLILLLLLHLLSGCLLMLFEFLHI